MLHKGVWPRIPCMMGGEDKTKKKGKEERGAGMERDTRHHQIQEKNENKMNQNKDLAQASIAESQWFRGPGYRPF